MGKASEVGKIGAGIFLVFAVALSTILGADTRAWAWSWAMIPLGLALLVGIWSCRSMRFDILWLAIFAAVSWFLVRSALSPVLDYGREDAFLAIVFLGAVTAASGIAKSRAALQTFCLGIAVVLLANVGLAFMQAADPSLSWPYSSRPKDYPSGFFGHYNYFANFTLGVTAFLAARFGFARIAILERIFLGIAVGAGLGGIAISQSRGAIVATALAFAVFVLGALFLLWRSRSGRAGKFALVLAPIAIAGALAVGVYHTQTVLRDRASNSGNAQITEDTARFTYFELAVETWWQNPWLGGGSHSYSWLRNSHWDVETLGWNATAEPHVHNELLQALTDYGIIGGVAVLAVIGLFYWRVFPLLLLGPERDHPPAVEWICLGSASAVSGVLAQANVSFVFHMVPAVLLTGLVIGFVQATARPVKSPDSWKHSLLPKSVGTLVVLPLLFFGFVGARTHLSIWPLFYTEHDPSVELVQQRTAPVLSWWPGFQIPKRWASFLQNRAVSQEGERRELLERSNELYKRAQGYHPYDPALPLNQANVLSALGRNSEAIMAFERAVELQGTLENAYHARFEMAKHLYRDAYRLWVEQRRAEEALVGFRQAKAVLEASTTDAGLFLYGGGGRPFLKQVESAIAFLEEAGIRAGEDDSPESATGP